MDTEKAWMLPAGLAAEPVGDQWMLCDTAGSTVFTAQGPAASVVGCVATHRPLPRHLEATAAELEAAGLLCRPHTASGGAMSRRRLLAAGGATAVGVGVMTLPVAGVAASPAPNPNPNLGSTWTTVAVPPTSWASVAHGAGVWVAVSATGSVIRSTDGGESWNTVTGVPEGSWNVVAWANGVWLVFGN